jgi:hypothetical protein
MVHHTYVPCFSDSQSEMEWEISVENISNQKGPTRSLRQLPPMELLQVYCYLSSPPWSRLPVDAQCSSLLQVLNLSICGKKKDYLILSLFILTFGVVPEYRPEWFEDFICRKDSKFSVYIIVYNVAFKLFLSFAAELRFKLLIALGLSLHRLHLPPLRFSISFLVPAC